MKAVYASIVAIWFAAVIVVVIIASIVAVQSAEQSRYALIIFPDWNDRPTCADEVCTPEENAAISTWIAAETNLWSLYRKIKNTEGWLLKGRFVDIVHPKKGLRVRKWVQAQGIYLYGVAVWFLMDRIIKPDPTQWFVDKVALMREAYEFRGYATDDPMQELLNRNFEIIVSGE